MFLQLVARGQPVARGGSQQQRLGKLSRLLLPMALPGPAGQRLVFAAIAADEQIKREARVQLELAKEAVKAGGFKNIAELTDIAPTAATIVAGLEAEDQTAIFQPQQPPPHEGQALRPGRGIHAHR